MKNRLLKNLTILFLAINSSCFAQFSIGHTTITFSDSSRKDESGNSRQIKTELFYPTDTSGNTSSLAGANIPVISFGHGFVMAYDSYDNIWKSLVKEGYIVTFPVTEGTLLPSHLSFSKDLFYVVKGMSELNKDSSTIFYRKISDKSAIMGHSMGGGAALLAAENNTMITTIITYAAADTRPSAISASKKITIPYLSFAGENDCVTPPKEHQNCMYDSLSSSKKTEITIRGGNHCYFANNNIYCSFGEATCSPKATIKREEQQAIASSFTKLWLKALLKDDKKAAKEFQEMLDKSNLISYRQNNTINFDK